MLSGATSDRSPEGGAGSPGTRRVAAAGIPGIAPASGDRPSRGLDRHARETGFDRRFAAQSDDLRAAWNFGAASLYNAAMLPRAAAAPVLRAAGPSARLASRAWRTSALVKGLARAVLFSSMALASTAHAQPPAPAPSAPPSDPKPSGAAAEAKKAAAAENPRSGSPRGRGGNKVISLDDEFLVEGKLEKPSAFYVLRRSSTDYDWARLDAVFTPLVLESVQDPLF